MSDPRPHVGTFYQHEWFGTTPRWPRLKWRKCTGHGKLPAIDSIADLECVLRQVAVCAFLADEPVLYRMALPYGHFSIGGHRKRVVLIGVLSELHNSRLTGAVRAHLLSVVNVRTPELRALEADEPQTLRQMRGKMAARKRRRSV